MLFWYKKTEVKLESLSTNNDDETQQTQLKKKIKTEDEEGPPSSSSADLDEPQCSPIHKLNSFTQWLFSKLFDPEWEHRHGAASGLREIIRKLVHALVTCHDDTTTALARMRWFEASLCKLFRVIALDRFADYIGDEVVAPVRETCTQTIGIISKLYTRDSVDIGRICAVINMFLSKDVTEWEISHSGKQNIRV